MNYPEVQQGTFTPLDHAHAGHTNGLQKILKCSSLRPTHFKTPEAKRYAH
jgi:hypothetical protein